jgi:hypothetical protein
MALQAPSGCRQDVVCKQTIGGSKRKKMRLARPSRRGVVVSF